MINGIDFGGKTKNEVKDFFVKKNNVLQKTTVSLESNEATATASARQINFGYDADLLTQQAFSIGRSGHILSDMGTIFMAYTEGVQLSPAYRYSEDKIIKIIIPLQKKIDVKPVEPLFNFTNGKVTAFQIGSNGRAVDAEILKREIISRLSSSLASSNSQNITIKIPVRTVEPAVTNDKANKMGIKELVGGGTSLFQHSIENRIFNLGLAASRLNGIIIPPGQIFSFTKTVGDISSLTGYKQAYVIENGKTVLGDGGGVCQVSTTLFRAALNAGLPIVERHPHAYRVGYYEQDSGPGIDAAIYYPNVDLKFKNDTGHSLLIQSYVDYNQQRLSFELYGTKDTREAIIGKPVIVSETPAPETLYQDDPTLPKGQTKQIDFAAPGANVYFTRTVKKDGKVTISDKFVSNYRPWQAVFLRGTKE